MSPIVAVAALLLIGGGEPGQYDKSFFADAIEGDTGKVVLYSHSGTLLAGEVEFFITSRKIDRGWEFSYAEQDRSSVKIRIGGPYEASLPARLTVFVPNARRDARVILIPFGRPNTSCFINGSEVYQNLAVTIINGHVVDVTELRFPECEPTYVSLNTSWKRLVSL
jgi:hypothetical protein